MTGEAFSVYVLDAKLKPNETKATTLLSKKLLTHAKCSPPEDLRGHSGGLAATGVPDTIQHNHI